MARRLTLCSGSVKPSGTERRQRDHDYDHDQNGGLRVPDGFSRVRNDGPGDPRAVGQAVRGRGVSSTPPGYPSDLPCSAKGAAIEGHNDEDQSTLQRGALSVRQERYGEAELN